MKEKTISTNGLDVEKRLSLVSKVADLVFFNWQIKTGTITFENTQMSEVLGDLPKNDSMELSQLMEYLHHEDGRKLEKAFSNTLNTGNEFSLICRTKPQNSSTERLVKFSGELEKDKSGQPFRIIGIAQDITHRGMVNEPRQEDHIDDTLPYGAKQLRLLTDALPVLISYVDHHQYYRFANRTYSEWFGSRSDQIIGYHLQDVLGEQAYQAILPKVKKVLSGEPVFYEQMIPYKNAGHRYVLVNYTPDIHSNKVKGFYVLVQDITIRKRHEVNQAFLAELSEELSRLSVANDIVQTVGKKLGEHLDISAFTFADLDEKNNRCHVEYAWYNQDGVPELKGDHNLSDFLGQDFMQSAKRGEAIVIDDTQDDPRIDSGNFGVLNIHAAISVPNLREDKLKYLITFTSNHPRKWRKDEVELLVEKANRLCLRIERARAEEVIRKSEAKLAAELEDTKQLQLISTQLIQQNNINMLFEQILDAGISLMDSQMASLQMLDQKTGVLELLTWRGFHSDSAAFWQKVDLTSSSACGQALRSKERVIIVDVDHEEELVHSEDYRHYKLSNIKSLQTTPLISRNGKLVGMISTHWTKVYEPSERELNMIDVLARQAADLIEGKMAEEDLKEADRKKDEFLATLSHELRNPLTPIKTALELMEDNTDEELKTKAHNIMVRQVDKMAHLLNDLMDISRITRGKIRLKRNYISLTAAIEAAYETVEPAIDQKGHSFSIHIPDKSIYINADIDRIIQIFTNLLTNAIKYTDPGGDISLRAMLKKDLVNIEVKDNGIGISKDHLETIFEMFNQVNQKEGGTQSGLGIGLSLSKNLVQMHNGTITAHSEGKGKGSTFTVTLPVVKYKASSQNAKTPLAKKNEISKRILIVDDNADIADTIQSGLSREGHELRVCYSGLEAIETAANFHPEVAILDIGLPDIEGYEVGKRLRKQFNDVLLIALTGWGQKKDKRKSRSAGFDYHLVKPAGIKEILDIINK